MKSNLRNELNEIFTDIQSLIEKYYLQAIVFALFSVILYVLFVFSVDIVESFYEMSVTNQTFKIIGSSIAFLLIITSGAFIFYATFYLIVAVEKVVKHLRKIIAS
jgi:hypothetical protein